MTLLEQLHKKIETRQARISVIGLGYVGLPVALSFARAGFRVTGIDSSPAKIERLKCGETGITDVSSDDLQATEGRFHPTLDYAEIRDQDVVIICVPTPLSKTKDPDLSYILDAVEGLSGYLRPGGLVVLESTTYPGTTDEVVLPVLSRSGMKAGVDFGLAYSPERIDPGNKQYSFSTIPKVVGGITPDCRALAASLYGQIVERVVPVSSTRTAEMVKLLENTFRSVNIGLVNEIALICDRLGIDVWETIEAAATKPFGFTPFYPGPGLGGHCIPIDPHYLSWKLKALNYSARFIALASEVNASMPHYVVEKVVGTLNDMEKSVKGSRVLLMGVAYKADVNDERESPAIEVFEILTAKGARVSYHDPHIPKLRLNEGGVRSVNLTTQTLKRADCVVILTAHRVFDAAFIVRHARAVVDTRNVTRGMAAEHICRL
ncbi:MAG: nucleotide sugar dehydrogenase [candidate division Zixibacteria bacterium]|nr:nucleotide sugar dehydrogenase [candidate division Zixibacteria bacterium]